ncbi:MAG: hypothetical protein WC243_03830 [Patescibacteria group bacterium]|jgi:hypothetical protein
MQQFTLTLLEEVVRQVKKEGGFVTFYGSYNVQKAMEDARKYGNTEMDIQRTVERVYAETSRGT